MDRRAEVINARIRREGDRAYWRGQARLIEEARKEAEQKKQEREERERMSIQAHIANIHNTRQSMAGWYREFYLDPLNAELHEIKADENLSAAGRYKKEDDVKAKYSKNVLTFAAETHKHLANEYAAITDKARQILDVATEKPDDLTVDRYRRSIADLKADIMLSLNPNTAADKVAELARSTSHPYLAEMLRDDLASVLAPITGNMKPEQRQAIAREVESLRTRFYTPEQVEAQKALVFVESSKSWSLFDGIVQENIRNQFGPNVAGILNNPEAIEARLNPPTDSENEASA